MDIEGFLVKEYLDMKGLMMFNLVNETHKEDAKNIIEKEVIREMTYQAYKTELIKKMRQRIGYSIDQYLDSEEFLNNNPVFKAEKERENKMLTRYIFLTVNPEPSTTLKMALDVIKKCCSKVWMKNYVYAIEQRGVKDANNTGNGFHIHFIIDTENGKKRHETIRELKNTFKKICDITCNSIFNIRNIKDDHLMNFMKYITGKKKDVIKHEKQKADREWRLKNNIAPLYGMGELLELYENNKDTLDDFDYNF